MQGDIPLVYMDVQPKYRPINDKDTHVARIRKYRIWDFFEVVGATV
jgi:hypothetical protein